MSHPSWKQCDHSEEVVEEEDIKIASFNGERSFESSVIRGSYCLVEHCHVQFLFE
jgi:hypothetical protein